MADAISGGYLRFVLVIFYAALLTAQEDHSQHQHAVAGLGTVDFPASCNATAQKLISRGAALLQLVRLRGSAHHVQRRREGRPKLRHGLLGRRADLVSPHMGATVAR